MSTTRTFVAVAVTLSVVASACSSGTGDPFGATDGDGQETTDTVAATPAADPTPRPTATPAATPEPPATQEPTATPSPEPAAALLVLNNDGTIDFEASEDNLLAETVLENWFESRSLDPLDVLAFHAETLGDIDGEAKDLMISIIQNATMVACEAGAVGINAEQFMDDWVAWSLSGVTGDTANMEVVAITTGFGALDAADEFCPADSPTVASGQPQVPEESAADPDVPGDDAGFVAQAAAVTGCTLSTPDQGPEAELNYGLTLQAVGFIDDPSQVAGIGPIESYLCQVGESSWLTFWKYADPSTAILSSEPILLGESDPAGTCWALTGYFEYLVLGLSASGVSPNAVDAVNALAALDAPFVSSGGDCG